jgi:hypothetical protein
VAFFRFNRDKRGYEYFYLVEPVTNRRGKTHTRVLYWYRTPPNVRVGRPPFDEDVRRALEAQNPGVSFDWPKIMNAPIPSADADKWRERRRAEKAEKAARAQAAARGAGRGEDAADPARAVAQSTGAASSDVPGTLGTREQPYHITSDQIRKRRRRRGRAQRPDGDMLAGEPSESPTQPDAAAAADAVRAPDEPADTGD